MKTSKLTVTVSSVVCFLLLLWVSCPASPAELASPIVPVVDREYLPAAQKLIEKAGKSISLSMFVVKRGEMVNKLIKELKNSAQRGVEVRILLDDHIAHNQRTVNSLKGIKNLKIKLDSPRKTTHNKMLIVDGETVLIGSTNWTDSSLGSADEANVIISHKEIAAYLEEFFEKLWLDSSRDISPCKSFPGEIVPLLDRQYFDAVFQAMKKAKKRIWVMVYGFKINKDGKSRGDLLAEEIIKATKRGVETRVFLEKSNFNQRLNEMNRETEEYLKNNGVETRLDREDIISHAKVVIIDNTVFLGATNWSYGGLELWHNSDVLIRDKKSVYYFQKYFERNFSH
ncbi:MAG: phospholipase D-like domain-containing protein [Candidatus Auribacterota bacterium]|nr:phospholipase D-like domain-containing protein [Candidatus Auribacterota bacterium]